MTRKAKTAALVLSGLSLVTAGIFLLLKDDVQQHQAQLQLEEYKPPAAEIEKLEEKLSSLEAAASSEPCTTASAAVTAVSTTVTTADSTVSAEAVTSELSNDENIYAADTVDNASYVPDYSDSIGWICIPGTNINYPVMYSGDNTYYLHRNFDGRYLYAGSVFLDGSNNPDFSDPCSILYGHSMNNGSMFADVTDYTDPGFLDAHPHGWLFTDTGTYCIEFFSAAVVSDTDAVYDTSLDIQTRLQLLEDKSVVWNDTEISENDRLLSLSTCSYEFKNARTILTGKLVFVE